jgi:hypothetical protein
MYRHSRIAKVHFSSDILREKLSGMCSTNRTENTASL